MDLLLTCFGLWPPQKEENREVDTLFYRMPPVSMTDVVDRFSPEYSVLLLYDKIAVDSKTFERLQSGPHPLYSEVAETVKALFQEGYVRLVDFDSILNKNRALLNEMSSLDMSNIFSWIPPLLKSITIWSGFSSRVRDILRTPYVEASTSFHGMSPELASRGHVSASPTATGRDELLSAIQEMSGNIRKRMELFSATLYHEAYHETAHIKALQTSRLPIIIGNYLNYVNANLVLSAELDIPFHDWADFSPFYERKFKLVGQKRRRGEAELSKVNQLFEVAFPSLAIRDVRTLLRVLKDNRIQDLRTLVSEAVRGETKFDQKFANRVLNEVLAAEFRLTRIRRVISYLTMPLSVIPYAGTLIQKGVDEVASSLAETKLRGPHRWFYLISDTVRPKRR